MSTPTDKQEAIPEEFREWAKRYADGNSIDAHPKIREHLEAEIYACAINTYRHLSQQKAAPDDGSETQDEKAYRKLSEWYLKQLRECQEGLRAMKAAPGMREGEKAVLDKDFNNASVVTVLCLRKHISTVTDHEHGKWDVTTGRLSPIGISAPEEAPTEQKTEEKRVDEWVEAATHPEKDGYYNVVTETNVLIMSCYRFGRWDYDMEVGGSDCVDFVARYRPSTHQPIEAAAPSTVEPIPQPGLQWVKANERLPQEDGPICLKMNGGYGNAFVRTAKNGSRYIEASSGMQIKGWKGSEWLEESAVEPIAPEEKEIRRQTINALYQQILALGVEFEPAAREVFHQAMNAL